MANRSAAFSPPTTARTPRPIPLNSKTKPSARHDSQPVIRCLIVIDGHMTSEFAVRASSASFMLIPPMERIDGKLTPLGCDSMSRASRPPAKVGSQLGVGVEEEEATTASVWEASARSWFRRKGHHRLIGS
eukprot:CAMPEP_0181431284 /NCGR_PEP_ID=MMETSP1110-20121109/18166_1 /TAXON_ID=174948 /ORGANISM="Symbiodinium sp., Strain CCMP421" /LENGTH=130 /DNA_ID=CAMNT_0023554639 /DNA_START=424 /DNA_END=816 /DNA_ORIENTATION=-